MFIVKSLRYFYSKILFNKKNDILATVAIRVSTLIYITLFLWFMNDQISIKAFISLKR